MAASIAAAGLGLVVAGVVFAWSGIYNVAASRDHWRISKAFLEFALRSSVRTHSWNIAAPPLDDADLVNLGARHYATGCALCHGAPGEPPSPLYLGMLPPPPSLARAALDWTAPELFWIVLHGIKYTGMPAWSAEGRDDEVWAVVAFLRRLPGLDAGDYRALAGVSRDAAAFPDTGAAAFCGRCHETVDGPPQSRLSPKLAGQPAAYLAAALRQYASGARPSGVMGQIAASLSDKEIVALSAYYADLPAAAPPPAQAEPARIERGRRIATTGAPADGVPPCAACHDAKARETFPRLAGQNARYIHAQLRLWKAGKRGQTIGSGIMAPIAMRLSDEQMGDVAAYYAAARAADDPPTRQAR